MPGTSSPFRQLSGSAHRGSVHLLRYRVRELITVIHRDYKRCYILCNPSDFYGISGTARSVVRAKPGTVSGLQNCNIRQASFYLFFILLEYT